MRWPRDRDKLKPGEASPVVVQLTPFSFEGYADGRLEGGHELTPRQHIVAKVRAIYATARAPYRPGQWLAAATFAWLRRSAAGGFTNSSIDVSDAGLLDYTVGTLQNETKIEILIEEEASSAVKTMITVLHRRAP